MALLDHSGSPLQLALAVLVVLLFAHHVLIFSHEQVSCGSVQLGRHHRQLGQHWRSWTFLPAR